MPISLTNQLIETAERSLSNADPVMRRLVKSHGPCPLANRERAPFDTLAGSIISQQLSAKAASTIKRRIVDVVGSPLTPRAILKTESDALRAAGLSGAKIRYVQELASRVCDGRLSFEALEFEEGENVISKLTEIPGVGRWTAEMFLIFGLKHPDVLAVHDAGLQRAARMLYSAAEASPDLLERISGPWRPYRSVASWYLWRHLDDESK